MPRRLGQHFLRPGAVARLIETIAPQPDDVFLEIGAGAGALTRPLAARCQRVVAVEIDRRWVDVLRAQAPANVEVVAGDALTLDLSALLPRGARLVGNLPYAISSPLLRRCLELRDRTPDMHLMVQREVAERVVATPGTKAYGLLSVLFGLWTDTTIPVRFGPSSFSPPPKVVSAVLRVRPLGGPRIALGDAAFLEQVVKDSLAHRRKTLENNLSARYPKLKQHLRLLDIVGSRRAETLSLVEFVTLAEALRGGGRVGD